MLRQQNDINLKVEDGDNFMSDYTTYTNYAKKAIDELQQLANFKKSLKGKKLADKIREAGLKLITKSGVDSILHGLGESNGFQNLTSAQKQIAEKLVSLKAQRKQIEFDMEQEAEPEGGPVADYYGDALQRVDGQIDMIMQKIRTNESMNEGFVSRLKKNLIGAELRK